ncbi:MAG: GlxA family transcriptional regulator [Alphaproteobacteria bacterium]|nr:GlxA family transcriptional regulator [Alphaproteobacteria bacterium]
MTKHCCFILHDGFSLITLAAITDAFFVANWQAGKPLYAWDTVSANGGPVLAFGNHAINTDPLDTVSARKMDIVFAVSSFDPHGLANASGVAGFLRSAHRFGARVVGLETGGVAMARAGLLTGRETAIHWANRDGFEEDFPEIRLSEAPVIRAGRCLTCAGGASAIDLALQLIEEDAGTDLARTVRIHLLYQQERPKTADSLTSEQSALVTEAMAIMTRHINDPMALPDLAELLGTSQRTLERHFQNGTGHSPQAHYLALRLTRAQTLLQQTALNIGEIAAETGFNSLPAFSRAYRKQFQVSPSQDRKQTVTASVPRLYA